MTSSRIAGRSFHLLGIGGAGMSVIAELLLSQGAKVSGSDARLTGITEHLSGLGVDIYEGHDVRNLPHGDDVCVVISSAIAQNNPELCEAKKRGLEILHRSQALVLAAQSHDFIAIAGAHGKTTTSAMIAVALDECGYDPSWAIGGSVSGYGSGAHAGAGSVFIAEADESDGSFLNYRPHIALVTNIENDHLDHYESAEALDAIFEKFAETVSDEGALIVCADDARAAALGHTMIKKGRTVVSYGRGAALEGVARHICITGESLNEGHPSGRLSCDKGSAEINLSRIVGAHNLLNAAGAWAVGVTLGIDCEDMARAVECFAGTGRRFEDKGNVAGVRLVDDYAHHPTEVRATILAAREQANTVRVLFQPHLYSRTRDFAEEFARALDLADDVIVTGVYGAREEPMDGIEGHMIVERMSGAARFIPDRIEAARALAQSAHAGDLLMTMGAGDVSELGSFILEECSRGS